MLFCSQIVVVAKQNGELRICLGPVEQNNMLLKRHYSFKAPEWSPVSTDNHTAGPQKIVFKTESPKNEEKCLFDQLTVKLSGHMLPQGWLRIYEEKVIAIKRTREP